MKIVLGVLDTPHGDDLTTGQLAQYLEDEYSVMGNFYELHQKEIAQDFTDGYARAVNAMLSGKRPVDPFKSACSKTEARFQAFIDLAEIEKMGVSGVPTQAALDGVRTSLKKKKEIKGKRYYSKVRGTRRASFFDTGRYAGAFKCWVTR